VVGVTSLLIARRAIRLAERQTALAERALQPHLWLEPDSPDGEEGTGNPMGAAFADGSFGFSMILGNDGGAAARRVSAAAFIGGKQVAQATGDPVNLPAGEQHRISLRIPGEHVAEVLGRGAPVFKSKLEIRAISADGPYGAFWP
jgi:hypothetical protein